jgi:hypothetical protein
MILVEEAERRRKGSDGSGSVVRECGFLALSPPVGCRRGASSLFKMVVEGRGRNGIGKRTSR